MGHGPLVAHEVRKVGDRWLGHARQQITPKSFMRVTDRALGCTQDSFQRCLWASLGQKEEVIDGGKGNLLLDLHQDSDQKQGTAGNVSVQVERQGGQRASEAACYGRPRA